MMSSKASSGEDEDLSYAGLGNAGHFATVVSALCFVAAVVAYAGDDDGENTFFDADWKKQGFCVAGQSTKFWTSHDVSFYCDVVLSFIWALLYWKLRSTKGLELPNKYVIPNLLGIVAHGLGHAAVAYEMRAAEFDVDNAVKNSQRTLAERIAEDSLISVVSAQATGLVFWLGLIYASMPDASRIVILSTSLLARYGQLYVPTHFAFTYVQTILILVFSLNQTMLPLREKKFHYALQPLLVALPTTLVGWLESTQCSAFVRDKFYGHVIYDGYIAVSGILWYLLCYYKARDDEEISKLKIA